MKVLRTDIQPLWEKFLSGGTAAYQQIADEFRSTQPELWKLLKTVDQEWFSAKTDHVVAYGVFIWTAITSQYGGARARVSQNTIDDIRREQQAFFASLEDESEFATKEAMAERRRTFSEPALAAHIEREFEEGSARAKELNPANNAVAVRSLLLVIDALARAGDLVKKRNA
jgi:hypothetical protein